MSYIWYGLILPCGAYYLYKLIEVSWLEAICLSVFLSPID